MTKYLILGHLEYLLLTILVGTESKIKMPADSVSHEMTHNFSQMALLAYPHMGE